MYLADVEQHVNRPGGAGGDGESDRDISGCAAPAGAVGGDVLWRVRVTGQRDDGLAAGAVGGDALWQAQVTGHRDDGVAAGAVGDDVLWRARVTACHHRRSRGGS